MLKHSTEGGGQKSKLDTDLCWKGSLLCSDRSAVMYTLDQSHSLLSGLHKRIIIPSKVISEVTIHGVIAAGDSQMAPDDPTSWFPCLCAAP